MEEYSIVDALVELKPGAEWSIGGRDYEQLVWLDKSQTKPTLDELNTKLSEITQQSHQKLGILKILSGYGLMGQLTQYGLKI